MSALVMQSPRCTTLTRHCIPTFGSFETRACAVIVRSIPDIREDLKVCVEDGVDEANGTLAYGCSLFIDKIDD